MQVGDSEKASWFTVTIKDGGENQRREITQVMSKERYSLEEHHSLRITEHYSSILNLGKVMQ